MNFEPSGTPGGIVEVFHWGQRTIPIHTPNPELFSAVRITGKAELKGVPTRTISISCPACGLTHAKQNVKGGAIPQECLAILEQTTEYTFECDRCKVSYADKKAFQAHN
jgi:hypothetical protein